MIDLAYIAGTFAFFALMLGYVRGCERLGREPAHATPSPRDEPRP